jgi:hypothetical protein
MMKKKKGKDGAATDPLRRSLAFSKSLFCSLVAIPARLSSSSSSMPSNCCTVCFALLLFDDSICLFFFHRRA